MRGIVTSFNDNQPGDNASRPPIISKEVSGAVTTQITGNQASGFLGTVRGTGSNFGLGGMMGVPSIPAGVMAWINQTTGPDIFAAQLQQANMDLLSACGG
jgi:hypothetical protein